MKKISNIVLLVGAILGFTSIFVLLVIGIIFAIIGSPLCTDTIIEGVKNGSVHSDAVKGTPEEIAAFVQMIFTIIGIILFVSMIPVIISSSSS